MKAFTVYPWYAFAFTSLGKQCENRTWKPTLAHGEWVAIHAGARKLGGARHPKLGELLDLVRDAEAAGWESEVTEFGRVRFIETDALEPTCLKTVAVYDDRHSPRSAIVAVAQFNGATQGIPMPWGHTTGYQWRFTSVMPLARPVSIRGAQGLWRVPPVMLRKMVGQVPESVLEGEKL